MKPRYGLSLVLLVIFTGCGESKVPVSGTVLYNSQPLPNVNVVMIRNDGKVASGVTDGNGSFASVTTDAPGDGALPGDYQVVITPVSTVDGGDNTVIDYSLPTKSPFPQSYMSVETSGFKAVVESGMSPVQFELKD